MATKRSLSQVDNNISNKLRRLEVNSEMAECLLKWFPVELLVKILKAGGFEELIPLMCTNSQFYNMQTSSLAQSLIQRFYEHHRSQHRPQNITALTPSPSAATFWFGSGRIG